MTGKIGAGGSDSDTAAFPEILPPDFGEGMVTTTAVPEPGKALRAEFNLAALRMSCGERRGSNG